jgi:hypothetical protein
MRGFGGLHIASLDGVEGFECGVSDPFAVLSDGTPTSSGVEIPFRFSHVGLDADTVAALRDAFFNLQIHQVRDGNKAALVAVGRVPVGASVAACLENGATTSRIELLGGDGTAIGGTTFTTAVDSPALPLALLPPIDAKSSAAVRLGFASPTADPDSLRAALLAMRTVRGVRIQILRCSQLRDSTDGNRIPMPYVYYTATLERSPVMTATSSATAASAFTAFPGGSTTNQRGRSGSFTSSTAVAGKQSFASSSSSSATAAAGDSWPLAHIISDTAVHTRSRVVTNDPVFDVEPKDHTFTVFDAQVAAFFRHAVLSFVVYDVNCEQPEQHLGMASVPLAAMLQSPTSSIIETDFPLRPHGTISFTISWIR